MQTNWNADIDDGNANNKVILQKRFLKNTLMYILVITPMGSAFLKSNLAVSPNMFKCTHHLTKNFHL